MTGYVANNTKYVVLNSIINKKGPGILPRSLLLPLAVYLNNQARFASAALKVALGRMALEVLSTSVR